VRATEGPSLKAEVFSSSVAGKVSISDNEIRVHLDGASTEAGQSLSKDAYSGAGIGSSHAANTTSFYKVPNQDGAKSGPGIGRQDISSKRSRQSRDAASKDFALSFLKRLTANGGKASATSAQGATLDETDFGININLDLDFDVASIVSIAHELLFAFPGLQQIFSTKSGAIALAKNCIPGAIDLFNRYSLFTKGIENAVNRIKCSRSSGNLIAGLLRADECYNEQDFNVGQVNLTHNGGAYKFTIGKSETTCKDLSIFGDISQYDGEWQLTGCSGIPGSPDIRRIAIWSDHRIELLDGNVPDYVGLTIELDNWYTLAGRVADTLTQCLDAASNGGNVTPTPVPTPTPIPALPDNTGAANSTESSFSTGTTLALTVPAIVMSFGSLVGVLFVVCKNSHCDNYGGRGRGGITLETIS
jgi:hypothetical protein